MINELASATEEKTTHYCVCGWKAFSFLPVRENAFDPNRSEVYINRVNICVNHTNRVYSGEMACRSLCNLCSLAMGVCVSVYWVCKIHESTEKKYERASYDIRLWDNTCEFNSKTEKGCSRSQNT